MKKIFFGVIGLLLLLILAAAIIPFLIPSSVYKSTIQDQLSERLGRDVMINGDVKISPLPSLKVKAGGVIIDNPDGFTAENFASMEGLDVKIKLLPLLSKKVEITAFELDTPKISLEKRADGKTNWVLGDDTGSAENAGPFKRDGRYADLNTAIGKFSIKNGSLDYSDAVNGRSHKLKDINMALSLPSLAQTMSADGNLVLDGIPSDIDLTLETPQSFLLGQKTPVNLKIGTVIGTVSAKGYFTESEDIHFALDLNGTLRDLNPLSRFMPQDLAVLDIAESLEFSGNYKYDGKVLLAKGADIAVSGPILKSRYTGDARISDKFGGTGALDLSISDIPKLTKILNIDTPAANILKSADIKTKIRLEGDTVKTEQLKATAKGEGLDLEFDGAGEFGPQQILSGRFSSNIASVPELAKRLKIENPQLNILGKTEATGQFNFDGENLNLSLEDANTVSDNLSGKYSGDISLKGETIELDGGFEGQLPNVTEFTRLAGIDTPYAAAVGALDAKGQISGTSDDLAIENLNLQMKGGRINGSYNGLAKVNRNAGITLNGAFDGDIPQLLDLAETTGTEIPYAQSIGRIQARGKLAGNTKDLSIKDMQINLTDGQLNGKFEGNAIVKDGFALNGHLDAEIPSARNLTRTTTGVELPPSTEVGQIYERIALSGQVDGNPAELRFSSAELSMDAMNGDGNFKLDLTQQKPTLSGTLDMGQINLRPYMAAYSSASADQSSQPWSEIPYDFTALRVMDGNYILKTPEVLFGPLTFGQTSLDTTVENGVMTARLPEISLYGGLGILTATLDASGDIPRVKLAVTLEDIRSNRFLSSIANFTKLEGQGHTLLEITGEGRTQGEIMRSLDGYGDFEVIGGVIQGIDLSKFMTGIDETLAQRVLPSGIGEKYATKFDDMVGKFKIKDGVISIESINLQALGVLANGSGELDIGQKRVDLGLRPRLTNTNAGDLAKFGVPLRFKGSWGNVKPGPDFDFLQKIAVEKAKIRAREEISQRVGGQVGNVLGNILGAPETEPEAPVEEKTSEIQQPENPEIETTTESPPQPDVKNPEAENNESGEQKPEEKKLEEEILEKAFDGLFGKKKETPGE